MRPGKALSPKLTTPTHFWFTRSQPGCDGCIAKVRGAVMLVIVDEREMVREAYHAGFA